MRRKYVTAVLSLFLLAAGTPLAAQVALPWRDMVWSESFTTTPPPGRYHFGGAAQVDLAGGHVMLTPEAESRSGRLFLRRLLPVSVFDLSFRGWFGSAANGGGADGIVAVFAPLYDHPPNGGGALDFDGCLGYGVEFDTYQNEDLADRSQEHVAVIKDVSSNHLRSETLASPTLEDERWHVLRVRFRSGTVEVFVDGQRRLDMQITDFFPFDGFFGFTSATGFAFNEHRIDDISLSLPTRRGTDLGVVSACGGAALDTLFLLRNNHPDASALAVTSVLLQSFPPGVFSLASNPAPATIAPGEDLGIPLRFRATDAGAYSAILRIDAANGETVFDTIRIIAENPVLDWDPSAVVFPPTLVGDAASETVLLRNVGRVEARVTSLRWSSGATSPFTTTAALPATLRPGETLPVTIRFQPDMAIAWADSLLPEIDCGQSAALAVSGSGSNERLRFRLETPFVLSPGESDLLVVYLDSLPLLQPVEALRFTLRIPSTVFAPDGIERIPGGLETGAVISAPVVAADAITFDIAEAGGWRRAGAMFALRFTALEEGPLCEDILLEWEALRPYRLTGLAPGRACINPSCRHPEGLYFTGIPGMEVSPVPARRRITVHVDGGVPQPAVIALYDMRGRVVRRVFDGILPAQGAAFTLPTEGLSSGYYTLFIRCVSGPRSLPVLVRK